jgi:hypothetical protein
MAKRFLCPCGRRWIAYVGSDFKSTCCNLDMTPMDDGQPMPPTGMDLREAFKLMEEDDDTIH